MLLIPSVSYPSFFKKSLSLILSCAYMTAYPKASTSPASQAEHFRSSPEFEE
jgi:hypothetical protein